MNNCYPLSDAPVWSTIRNEEGQRDHVQTNTCYELYVQQYTHQEHDADSFYEIKILLRVVPGQPLQFKLLSLFEDSNNNLLRGDADVTFFIRESEDGLCAVGEPLLPPTH